jgi:hypothetical protein
MRPIPSTRSLLSLATLALTGCLLTAFRSSPAAPKDDILIDRTKPVILYLSCDHTGAPEFSDLHIGTIKGMGIMVDTVMLSRKNPVLKHADMLAAQAYAAENPDLQLLWLYDLSPVSTILKGPPVIRTHGNIMVLFYAKAHKAFPANEADIRFSANKWENIETKLKSYLR